MDHNIDKFVRKLSSLESNPREDLFEVIYKETRKRSKRRFWIFLFSGVLSLVFMVLLLFVYNVGSDHQSPISYLKQTEQTKEDTNSIYEKLFLKEEGHKTKIYDDGSSGEVVFVEKYREDMVERVDRVKNSAVPDNSGGLPLKQHKVFHEEKELSELKNYSNNIEGNEKQTDTASQGDIKIYDLSLSGVTELRKQFNFPVLKGLLRGVSYVRKTLVMKPTSDPKYLLENDNTVVKPKFKLKVAAITGSQEFCSYTMASQQRLTLNLTRNLGNRTGIMLGISKSNISYDFLFTDELNNRFGTSSKFPGLPLLRSRTTSIANDLTYYSLDFGLKYDAYSIGRHNFLIGLEQELVFFTHQELSYGLIKSNDYIYVRSEGVSIFNNLRPFLEYNYSLSKVIAVNVDICYNYSLSYLGLEKERYSGFNYGLGFTYGWR